MGRRGPKPQPTAIKKAKGNPGKRPLNDQEPTPDLVQVIEPPEWLDDVAKEKFRELAPHLIQLGVLTVLDVDTLARCCHAHAMLLPCLEELRKGTTITVETGAGSFRQSKPEFNQAIKLITVMKQLGAELGLSPSARTGIKVETNKPGNRLREFATQRKQMNSSSRATPSARPSAARPAKGGRSGSSRRATKKPS